MAYFIYKSYKLKLDPLNVFSALKDRQHCFFLDSSLNLGSLGRYSFLGIEPFRVFSSKNTNPFPALREALGAYDASGLKNGLPFLGGAVGYLSYDVGFSLERRIKIRKKPGCGHADCFFGFYNSGVIIDNYKKQLYVFSLGLPEKNYLAGRLLARENFKKINGLLAGFDFSRPHRHKKQLQQAKGIESNFPREGYLAAVKKAKRYISTGDIYQVNLSQEFKAGTNLDASQIYARLRDMSPSCFAAYMDCQGFQIISSSPERFLSFRDNIAVTRPMKGTRPRFGITGKDRRLKNELLSSAKDKAELMMIVDLERNDLGKVCDYDSIRVRNLRNIEEYSTVFQATADISGRLYEGKDRIDLLQACFPGGSITGCPKIRAMEIIEELEPQRRFIYTGCLGYLSFTGDMDFNILIRTMLKEGNRVKFSSGGGIVADSRPEEEYEETLVKAKAMMEAVL